MNSRIEKKLWNDTMKRHRSNSGFTLIELTCALFIVTTAGFGAIQLYSIGIDKILEMREFDVATELLRNEMEQIRTLSFDAVANRDSLYNPSPASESLHKAEGAVRITDAAAGLKEVTVTLRWQARHGRWITRSLTTRIANKGVTVPPTPNLGGRAARSRGTRVRALGAISP
jgi:prepilin-type N-terminal cleavage/methylation domain-containing protein